MAEEFSDADAFGMINALINAQVTAKSEALGQYFSAIILVIAHIVNTLDQTRVVQKSDLLAGLAAMRENAEGAAPEPTLKALRTIEGLLASHRLKPTPEELRKSFRLIDGDL